MESLGRDALLGLASGQPVTRRANVPAHIGPKNRCALLQEPALALLADKIEEYLSRKSASALARATPLRSAFGGIVP